MNSAFKRLVIELMAKNAIPTGGGVADGLAFLSSSKSIADGFKKAEEEAKLACWLVRSASEWKEPNPWKDADDETIAAELMRQIDERKAKERPWSKLNH